MPLRRTFKVHFTNTYMHMNYLLVKMWVSIACRLKLHLRVVCRSSELGHSSVRRKKFVKVFKIFLCDRFINSLVEKTSLLSSLVTGSSEEALSLCGVLAVKRSRPCCLGEWTHALCWLSEAILLLAGFSDSEPNIILSAQDLRHISFSWKIVPRSAAHIPTAANSRAGEG